MGGNLYTVTLVFDLRAFTEFLEVLLSLRRVISLQDVRALLSFLANLLHFFAFESVAEETCHPGADLRSESDSDSHVIGARNRDDYAHNHRLAHAVENFAGRSGTSSYENPRLITTPLLSDDFLVIIVQA